MKTPEEFKKFILKNFRNEDGDIEICNVDLSDFDGDVFISNWTVKNDLHQGSQKVGGDLRQGSQKVGGDLDQCCQTVGGDLWQHNQEFGDTLYDHKSKEDEKIVDESDDFVAIKMLQKR